MTQLNLDFKSSVLLKGSLLTISRSKVEVQMDTYIISVQLLSCVQLFVTPWMEACQASLSFTFFQSLLKLVSIGSVMPSNHLVLYHPLLLLPSTFPSIRVFFLMSRLFVLGGQSIRASASVLLMNIQG